MTYQSLEAAGAGSRQQTLRKMFLAVTFLGLWLLAFALQTLAQSDDDTFADPVNLSQSGAASDPAIVPLPSGSLRVFWWDQFDGTMVAVGVPLPATAVEPDVGESVTETTTATLATEAWSAPQMATILVPKLTNINGDDVLVPTPIASAPEIVGDTSGRAHAFWLDEPDPVTGDTPLLYSQLAPGSTSWSTASSLSGTAGSFAVTSDISGTVHLVYVQAEPAQNLPVGLYHRQLALGGAGWSAPEVVQRSRYLRLLPPEEKRLRLSADRAGNLYAAWDAPNQQEILLARSTDGGATWSEAESFIGSGVQPEQGRVIALPGSTPAVIWPPDEDSQPKVVLSVNGNALKLSAWEGGRWGETLIKPLRFENSEQGTEVRLTEPHLFLVPSVPDDDNGVETLVVLGTDEDRDLWITANSMQNVADLLSGSAASEEQMEAWPPAPVNLSESGTASKPAIVVRPDGTLYAYWWDRFDGLTVADGLVVAASEVSGTEGIPGFGEEWAQSRAVPILAPETLSEGGQEGNAAGSLETTPRVVVDASGGMHAFWQAEVAGPAVADELPPRPLMYSRLEEDETTWSLPVMVSTSAMSFDVAPDGAGRLFLAYIQSEHTPESPAGVYFRRLEPGETLWTAAQPLQLSRYFRLLSPDIAHVRLATDEQEAVYVTWDEPRDDQLMLAYSPDGGVSWQEPVAVGGSDGRSGRGRLMTVPGGETQMLWEAEGVGGPCSLVQASVSEILAGDVGAGRPLLRGLASCPENERFLPLGDQQVLMVAGNGSETLILAAWDGQGSTDPGVGLWSSPVRLGFSFEDAATSNRVYLDDLQVALLARPEETAEGLAAHSILAVGTGQNGDVWATSSDMGALDIVFGPPSPWSQPTSISQSQAPPGLPAMAVDVEGQVHLLWTEAVAEGRQVADLSYASWDGEKWTHPSNLFDSVGGGTNEPSIVAVGDRLHAVWSNETGKILFSQAFARDAFAAEGWTDPKLLSDPTAFSQGSDIIADSDGTLHVAYAVPVNEKRGIYYTNSRDGEEWSPPSQVFDAFAAGWVAVDQPYLAADEFGFLHAVWARTALPGSGALEGVYYARSLDGGTNWSEPLGVAEGPHGWPQVAVTGRGQVHIVWLQEDDQRAWWHRLSSDAGETWTRPERILGFEDVTKPLRLLADDNGALHLVGLRQAEKKNHALLYSTWDGTSWGQPEEFYLEVESIEPGVSAVLETSLRHLDVVFRGQMTEEDETLPAQLWHIGRSVPTVAVSTGPAFVPQATTTPSATPPPTLTPNPTPSFEEDPLSGDEDRNLVLPVLLAGGVAALIVGAAVIGRLMWLSRR